MARTTSTPHKVSRNKSGTPIVRASKLFPGRPTRTTRETAFETEPQARIFADAIENLNSGIATYSKNVKRWQGGSMVVRWVSLLIERRRRSSVASRDGVTSRSSSRPSMPSSRSKRRTQNASLKLNQPSRRSEKINSGRDNPSQ